jgi:hypothetical protein
MVSLMKRDQVPQHEWWWEREWRKAGHFLFNGDDIAFGICPRDNVIEMEGWALETGVGPGGRLRFVSLDWTVEELIFHLVGAPEEPAPWPQARYGG